MPAAPQPDRRVAVLARRSTHTNTRPPARVRSEKTSFLLQAVVDGLDESIGGPRSCVGSEPCAIALRWIRCLYLCERHALGDHVLDDVRDDGDGVAILDHLRVVGH